MLSGPGKVHPPVFVPQEIRYLSSKLASVSDGYSNSGTRRKVTYVADGGSHRWYTSDGCLEKNQRPGLMTGRHHEEVCGVEEIAQPAVRQEPMKRDILVDVERTSEALHLTAQGVLSHNIHMEFHVGGGQQGNRLEQRTLILHAVQAAHVE